ncbi:MAG: formate dehydrogenase subunit alpha [Dehalococcoidales bacterium]|nr:formate dehydrogenase subunit alpha [Dehalococcoidales bacterium]
MDNIIKLTIDGEEVEATSGMTVLEVAEENGFFIPTLCSDPDLKPYGACRLCVVQIEGTRGFPTSCTTPATEGMVVHTDSPELEEMRRTAIQLIRSDHPTDCDACPKNQQCELQMMEALLNAAKSRFQTMVKDLPIDKSNPFFNIDRNYCILCGRCVRSCDEIRGVNAINLSNRGYQTRVSAGLDGALIESNCESCGECLDHCPVYTLHPKETRKAGREIESVCPYCGVGCGINLGIRQTEVVTAHGKKEGSVNNGSLCVKGRFGIPGFTHSNERLTSPLVKNNGEMSKASWDEAIDLVAGKFSGYKADEIAVIASAKCTNEDTYVAQKFARTVLGTNNVDNSARLSLLPSFEGLTRSFGIGAMTNSIEEINNAAGILAIDIDLTVTHPIVGLKVKNAVRNGAKLVVISTRGIDLNRFASLWLQIEPETEVALLMGMMKVIIDEGLLDSDYINEYCEGFEPLKKSLEVLSLDEVEKITGVSAEKVAEAARIYATSNPATILYGTDFVRNGNGIDSVSAVADLAMLTGNVGKVSSGVNPLVAQNNAQGACDTGALPDFYPGYQSVTDASIKSKFEEAWGCPLDPSQGLSFTGILDAARKKEIKALYVIGSNPVLGELDTDRVKESLGALEFLVVQDVFMTETAEMAHVVLPATTFAEKEGTFTNTERKVQRVRKAVDAPGESMHDWKIICQLAQKMGKEGFNFATPSKIMEEIAGLTPIYGGISFGRLEDSGLQWPCPDNRSEGTPVLHSGEFTGGKGQFIPLEFKQSGKQIDDSYPLNLMVGRSLYYTQTGTLARKVGGLVTLRGLDTVEINPEDASTLQITEDESVKVISANGEVTARAKITDNLPKGTVFMVFPLVNNQTGLLHNPNIDPVYELPKYVPCSVRIEKGDI